MNIMKNPASDGLKLFFYFFIFAGITLSPYITASLTGVGIAYFLVIILGLTEGIYVYHSFYYKKEPLATTLNNLKKTAPLFLIVALANIINAYASHYQHLHSLSAEDIPKLIYVLLIVPFCEEVFYRGCLFDSLCLLCSSISGSQSNIFPSFLTSLVFCVMHTQYKSMSIYVYLFLFSIILIIARVLTKGLKTPMLLHSFMNLLFFLTFT